MGKIKSSTCDSPAQPTVNLILDDDGKLLRFPYAVKVSQALQMAHSSPLCSFICDVDEMDFDAVLSPLAADRNLQPGRLYFVLPLARLRRRLRPEDMAELAVKASGVLSGTEVLEASAGEKEPKGDAGRRRGKFAARLTGIPE